MAAVAAVVAGGIRTFFHAGTVPSGAPWRTLIAALLLAPLLRTLPKWPVYDSLLFPAWFGVCLLVFLVAFGARRRPLVRRRAAPTIAVAARRRVSRSESQRRRLYPADVTPGDVWPVASRHAAFIVRLAPGGSWFNVDTRSHGCRFAGFFLTKGTTSCLSGDPAHHLVLLVGALPTGPTLRAGVALAGQLNVIDPVDSVVDGRLRLVRSARLMRCADVTRP